MVAHVFKSTNLYVNHDPNSGPVLQVNFGSPVGSESGPVVVPVPLSIWTLIGSRCGSRSQSQIRPPSHLPQKQQCGVVRRAVLTLGSGPAGAAMALVGAPAPAREWKRNRAGRGKETNAVIFLHQRVRRDIENSFVYEGMIMNQLQVDVTELKSGVLIVMEHCFSKMFQYEYEKRGPNAAEWGREPPAAHERPGLVCRRAPSTMMPLRVWAAAGAVCLVVCFMFVLATLFVSQWGRGARGDGQYGMEESPSRATSKYVKNADERALGDNAIDENDDDLEIMEKLAIFKNFIANRDPKTTEEEKATAAGRTGDNLINKPQPFPEHDTSVSHSAKKIEKKDQAKDPESRAAARAGKESEKESNEIPEFKPALPDVFRYDSEIKLPIAPDGGTRKTDFDYLNEYYEDGAYDDYAQGDSMTGYLIEKVQELHDWIVDDPDFEAVRNSTKKSTGNEFSAILKALNSSVVEGDASIIMSKLRDLYFDGGHAASNSSKRIILTNSTNLLSFGILTLDVLLLHNVHLMAWENQESLRNKMLRDPDVFAFSALFMDPKLVEAKKNEIYHPHENSLQTKRQNLRREGDEDSFAKNIFESVLELGMSAARAAINLGRSYKNTKIALNQISNRDNKEMSQNIRQLSRNADANAHALSHLQTFSQNDSSSGGAGAPAGFYTELDCVWHLYCKNLVATSKLHPPYGVMARINGVALRMLSGELSADRALDTLLYEAVTGWTDLKCSDMFPRCSRASAASVVLESILQPPRRSQADGTS
ncbi:hypothetical protein EVAR_92829_1 [Eumeta japonica]|uniref:Uncharacterized protein n=1 Tax=Eumeta variegata TaxID=151549 RepID=A0A4C1T9U1_EUMVA|nr:hypothetical protein EVAR_92829_1 [Eumeta japonica]